MLSYQFGMRYVLTYRLTDEAVRAVMFGYAPASAVRYEGVREARAISALEMLAWPVWRAQNRLFGPAVLIYGRGFFPVLSTPDDAEGVRQGNEAARLPADRTVAAGALVGRLRGSTSENAVRPKFVA